MVTSKAGKIKIVLLISLALNFITVVYFSSRFVYYKYYYAKVDLAYVQKLRQNWHTLLTAPADSAEIIFSGTSITQGFPLQLAFNNPHIINAGVGGSETRYTLSQVKQLVKRKPFKLFLETGINDLSHYRKTDTVFKRFVKITQAVKSGSPGTVLYVQSVFPTAYPDLNNRIISYNQRVSNYCQLHQIAYINLYPLFLKNGFIDPELTLDGIHISDKGYAVWKSGIARYVSP
jgi:lysophospholipase L1-like esterase